MQTNMKLTSQRGEQLDNLQDKTDALAGQANGFRRGANRVRKQMWWKGHEDADVHHHWHYRAAYCHYRAVR